MEVILREDIDKLGTRGQVVKVAAGIRPQFPAPQETGGHGHRVQQEDHRAGAPGPPAQGSQAARRGAGPCQADDGVIVTISQKAGENDQLFGSVTSKDVADALAVKDFTIDRRKIQLDEPIKQLGEFKVPVKLHKDVTAEVTVVVAKEE